VKRPLGLGLTLFTAALAAPIRAVPVINADFFPYSHGWLGADAAYSVPLDPTTTVWLFGDTFVGNRRGTNTMIHNSIAIRRCGESCELTYWWSGQRTRNPDAFFKTPQSNYFWPLDGFTHGGKLYVFLEQMRATGEGGAFGFDYRSVSLATVSNPTVDPDKWLVSYNLVSEGNHVVPGIATAVVKESNRTYAYIFTLFRRSAPRPFVGLIRCPVNHLPSANNKPPWQYLSSSSRWLDWSPSTSPSDAWEAFGGNVTEMSVKHHPESDSWLAVFPTPGLFSKTASYSIARHLSGPWTAPRSFFTYPEMEKNDPRYTPSIFCYAAKEHPELESSGVLVFTYACNSLKEAEIFADTRLYRPELVEEKLPVH